MINYLFRVIASIIGNFSPILKAFTALITGSGIYMKDAYYIKTIGSFSSNSFSIIGDLLSFQMSYILLPIFIIGLEVLGLFMKKEKCPIYFAHFIEKIPLLIIVLLTLEKYLFPELGEDKWTVFVTTIKCIILIFIVYILHEFFLHALKESKEHFSVKTTRLRLYIQVKTKIISLKNRIQEVIIVANSWRSDLQNNLISCWRTIISFKNWVLFSMDITLQSLNSLVVPSLVCINKRNKYWIVISNYNVIKYAVTIFTFGLFFIF